MLIEEGRFHSRPAPIMQARSIRDPLWPPIHRAFFSPLIRRSNLSYHALDPKLQ
jgi:hypothetical protein